MSRTSLLLVGPLALFVACGSPGEPAKTPSSSPTASPPIASTTAATPAPVPSWYPVRVIRPTPEATKKASAAFEREHPGWGAQLSYLGTIVWLHVAPLDPTLTTEAGARAFVSKNAALLNVDASKLGTASVLPDRVTFGATTWGKYTLGGLQVSAQGVSGNIVGPFESAVPELPDETLTARLIGKEVNAFAGGSAIPMPCDPVGPNHLGCGSGLPIPIPVRHRSVKLDARHVHLSKRAPSMVQAPTDPTTWEIRIVATIDVDAPIGCDPPPGDRMRVECRAGIEIDGKPASRVLFDAVTGDDLTGRGVLPL